MRISDWSSDVCSSDLVPNLEFEDFDITDHDLFLTTAANSVYARNRFVTDRRDRIWAGRLDVERELDGFITSVKVGGRYSDHHRTNDNARNNDLNTLAAIDGATRSEERSVGKECVSKCRSRGSL